MQLGCYVLMDFEAVERYIDLLLVGFLFLEKKWLKDIRRKNALPNKGDPESHWRTTDRLRNLEAALQRFNLDYIRWAHSVEETPSRTAAQVVGSTLPSRLNSSQTPSVNRV